MTTCPPAKIVRGLTPPGAIAWVPAPGLVVVRAGEPLTPPLIAHELAHVEQWRRHGPLFPLVYAWRWAAAGFSYARHPMEIEARGWETDSRALACARELIARHPALAE